MGWQLKVAADRCASVTCANGGQCYDDGTAGTCICDPLLYSGTLCEVTTALCM